jgi:hypothetical protein
MAQNAPDATSALEQISLQVSSDPALAAMRVQDPDQLALALTKLMMIIYGKLLQLP